MPTVVARMWERIVAAQANLYDFMIWLNEFSVRFFESAFAVNLFGAGADFGTVISKYAWIPWILMLFGLLEASFGRRFLSLQKLLLGFIIGFAVGAVYIAPAVSKIVTMDHFIIGIAIGLVFAVFRTPLYFLTLSASLTYFLYYQLVGTLGFGRFFAILVSLIAVVLIFIFVLKWLELVGTALLGGWIFAGAIGLVADYPPEHGQLVFRLIAVTVAVLGFAVQFKWTTKKKKKKDEGRQDENRERKKLFRIKKNK